MRARLLVGVMVAACGSSKPTVDGPAVPRQTIGDLGDVEIAALVQSAYGNEVLTLRRLDNFSGQTARPDGCPAIGTSGNVVTISPAMDSCARTNPPAVNYDTVTVTGSATITNSRAWTGITPDANAPTVYASNGLTFQAFHVASFYFGGLDGSLDVSPTGLSTGDITYHASTTHQPPPLEVRVQWTCDVAQTHCDVGGTEIVWKGTGSIAVTGALDFASGLTQEHGTLTLQGVDRLEATWSGAPNQPVTWSLDSGRTGSVSLSSTVGYDWNN